MSSILNHSIGQTDWTALARQKAALQRSIDAITEQDTGTNSSAAETATALRELHDWIGSLEAAASDDGLIKDDDDEQDHAWDGPAYELVNAGGTILGNYPWASVMLEQFGYHYSPDGLWASETTRSETLSEDEAVTDLLSTRAAADDGLTLRVRVTSHD